MNKKQILNDEEIQKALNILKNQIVGSGLEPKDTVFIGIITRGGTIAKRLSEKIKIENNQAYQVGLLDTRSHRDDKREEVKEDLTDLPFDINNKNVLLIDDVISSGRTIRAAMDSLIHYGRPKIIKTAILVDRGHRELPIKSDYTGTLIPTSIKEKIKVRMSEVDGGKDRAYIIAQKDGIIKD